MQLAENSEAAGERSTDTDPDHQQIEEQRAHAAEHDDDEQDRARERCGCQHGRLADRRPRCGLGEEHGAQAPDLKVRVRRLECGG